MHAFLVPTLPAIAQAEADPDTLKIFPSPTTIGIDQIRAITTFLSRKPLSGEHHVIIYEAHLLTLPAQHAILKILEEPPADSQIYLVTISPNQLLPTILSRVQVATQSSSPDISASVDLFHQLSSLDTGQRLLLLDQQAFTRPSALQFLDHLEHHLHQKIINHEPLATSYELICQTRKYLKANVNLTLAMDYFALNLPSPYTPSLHPPPNLGGGTG